MTPAAPAAAAGPTAAMGGRVRRRLEVRGVVQGVGFRPFVYRLAREEGLDGHVGNDASGVFIEVEGERRAVESFAARLRADAPPLAVIESVSVRDIASTGTGGFEIRASVAGRGARTLVPPDVATCDACLAELADPADRRYRYPFINCTNCGPRYTIIRSLPYDRPATSMAGFPMCAPCRAEYADPADRRYHAQPVACPDCGPVLWFERGGVRVSGTDAALAQTQRALAAGEVVAIKGIGGYHLAADAASDAALASLRARKGRAGKPFALMVPSLAVARAIAFVDAHEQAALCSPARPIVLLRRRATGGLSPLVAPGNPRLGVMLPYSPLHHLLFSPLPGFGAAPDAPPGGPPVVLVLTSGNLSDEPICTGDGEARARLSGLADAFLVHDRPIEVPCDDSVVRVIGEREQPVRRSRGYAPLPVALPVDVAPTLAVGGELKNTFCLASGGHAWMSAHIGDMETLETLEAFSRSAARFEQMYAVLPEVLAADLHPRYQTRRWAETQAPLRDARLALVQHHHAHVAALMAEHGLDGAEPLIGVAFDGTGYGEGPEGPSAWGGEVLVADYRRAGRAFHLSQLPLPGGDGGVRNPCRTALAYLHACGIDAGGLPPYLACDETERRVVPRQVERGVGCTPTSSMGRLFDVVSSLLGVRHRISYEAQAAMELEALAVDAHAGPIAVPSFASFGVRDGRIDPAPVLRALAAAVRAGADVAVLALAFHEAVATAVLAAARAVRASTGLERVGLTGGVHQNALLVTLTRPLLEADGFEVLTHRLVPANDGGLALGQAVIAGHGALTSEGDRPCA